MPSSQNRIRFAGVALAVTWILVPARATAQDQPPPPATPEQTAAWQAELDRAQAQRSSGRKLEFIGAGITVGGVALFVHAFTCHSEECGLGSFVGGLVVEGAGIGVGDAGYRRAHDANIAIEWLDVHGPAPMAPSTWQLEMDRQRARRATGQRTKYVGWAIAGAGLIVSRLPSDCGYSSSCYRNFEIGNAIALGGAIVSGVGSRVARDASLTMGLLHAHPPAGAVPLAVSLTERSTLSVGLGRTTSVQWQVRW